AAEDLRRYRARSGYKHSVLVLDEPTVFLPEEEVERLFDLIRTVVAEGAAVLFISHDLVAIRSITDRVVVLRDGRVVAEVTAGEIDERELVDLIVGTPTRSVESAQAEDSLADLIVGTPARPAEPAPAEAGAGEARTGEAGAGGADAGANLGGSPTQRAGAQS